MKNHNNRTKQKPPRVSNITDKALVLINVESLYAFSGELKGSLSLESLNKKIDGGQFILVSSLVKPKNVVMYEGELPLSIIHFHKIESDELSQLIGKKLTTPTYIAKLNFPDLIKKSIIELWSGKFAVDFEKIGPIQFSIKKNIANELVSVGNPDNIKRNIDSVSLRPDLSGNVVLEVEGWALGQTSSSCSVSLFFDDLKMTSTLTKKMRQDVLEFYKVNIPITPGFVLEAKLPSPTPKNITILIKDDQDSVVLKFAFEKIPGASKYEKQEETIFRDLIENNYDTPWTDRHTFEIFKQSNNTTYNTQLSIIIPTNLSTDNIFDLVKSLRQANSKDEIIIIGHGVSLINKNKLIDISDRYIHVEGKFNWSKFNNKGASVAKHKQLLFLNDDVLPIALNWRQSLDKFITDKSEYGIIGARLLGKDLKIQHDGISLYGKFTNHINVGMQTLIGIDREFLEVDAVTGAFLLTNKNVFTKLNGFDESLKIIGNDLDFCLRAGSMGYQAIIPSNLIFFHAEGSSRSNLVDNDISESLDIRLPNSGRFRILDQDRAIDHGSEKISFYSRNIFNPKSVALIKIDHIGDFFSSLDAIKLLITSLQKAKFTLICSPEVALIAKKLNLFSDVIPVRVFNKISGDGLDFKNLPSAIKQKKFDLAIDYRKHDEVRSILHDIKASTKFCFSQNTAQDINNIIYFSGHNEAKGSNYLPSISNEYSSYTSFIIDYCRSFPEEIPMEAILTASSKVTNLKKRIAIFPQSGNSARQYPLSLFMQFAIFQKKINSNTDIIFYVPSDQIGAYISIDSIDLLRKNKINVEGLSDASKIADAVSKSDLIVTNNTGPMWIASSLSIPCIALFSSVVSKLHWLPKNVYQISRNTSCSPCYISAADQCHRNMFCLNSIDPSYINALVNYVFRNAASQQNVT